jgi:hypothetical protein
MPPIKGQFNPFQNDIVDFAPLLEGGFPKALMHGHGQVDAGVNDSRPLSRGCPALGLAWGGGWGSAALGHERLSYGLARPMTARSRGH